MLPCSAIQRLERVATTQNQAGSAAASTWNCIKDADQLSIQTLCDSSLWETSVDFLRRRPTFPISDALIIAMSRSVQLLVGIRQLGNKETLHRAEEAAKKAEKKFKSNQTKQQKEKQQNQNQNNNEPKFEAKFENFNSRCRRIISCLCEIVAGRRYRTVALRAIEKDPSCSVVVDMFLAASELSTSSSATSKNQNEQQQQDEEKEISQKLHRLLFSMILFLSSVKERNSNTVAILPSLFNRSLCIGPHVERNLLSSQSQSQSSSTTTKKSDNKSSSQQPKKTSVVETILELEGGQDLLAALLKPVVDTHGARAAVYYNSDASLLAQHRVSAVDWISFDSLISFSTSTNTSSPTTKKNIINEEQKQSTETATSGDDNKKKTSTTTSSSSNNSSSTNLSKNFPPTKQLEFLSSVFSAFCSCDSADEYFQERKKAMIRSELAAIFSSQHSSSSSLLKKKQQQQLQQQKKKEQQQQQQKKEESLDDDKSDLSLGEDDDDDNLSDISSVRASSVASAMSSVSTSNQSNFSSSSSMRQNLKSSANIRVTLMCRLLNKMSTIVQNVFSNCDENENADDKNDNNNNALLLEQVTSTWWSCVQRMFETLQQCRGLVPSDDMRYNNGLGFDSVFRLVKTILLDSLSIVVGDQQQTTEFVARATSSMMLLFSSSSMNKKSSDSSDDDDDAASTISGSTSTSSKSSYDAMYISLLEENLSELSSCLLSSNNNSSSNNSSSAVLGSICKCLTCVGKLAPTHLMRFLPVVVKSLTRVRSSSVSSRKNKKNVATEKILELLCFAIEYLGKLNQCSSFLRSLLNEVVALQISDDENEKNKKNDSILLDDEEDSSQKKKKKSKSKKSHKNNNNNNILLFHILRDERLCSATRQAAMETLDPETILNVVTEICDIAFAKGIIINNNEENDSSTTTMIHAMFPIASAVVSGITVSPVSGLSVTEQLVAADATLSVAISSALSSSSSSTTNSQQDSLIAAIQLVTNCRRKLFLVLQNAGVPAIDELLLSLNRSAWQFPSNISSLFIGMSEDSSFFISPEQLCGILSSSSSSSEQQQQQQNENEENNNNNNNFVFSALACSQLRLAAIVNQMLFGVDEEQKEDLLMNKQAFEVAHSVVEYLTSTLSSSSCSSNKNIFDIHHLDTQDVFLLRQLDPEGTSHLIRQLSSSSSSSSKNYSLQMANNNNTSVTAAAALVSGDLISGTESSWEVVRGDVCFGNSNKSSSNATATATATTSPKAKSSSSSSNTKTSLAEQGLSSLFSISFEKKEEEIEEKEEETSISLLRTAVTKIVNTKHASSSQSARQELLKAAESSSSEKMNDDDNNDNNSLLFQTCVCDTIQYLAEQQQKNPVEEEQLKNKQQQERFTLLVQNIVQLFISSSSSSSSAFNFLTSSVFPILAPLSHLKISLLVTKVLTSIPFSSKIFEEKNNNNKPNNKTNKKEKNKKSKKPKAEEVQNKAEEAAEAQQQQQNDLSLQISHVIVSVLKPLVQNSNVAFYRFVEDFSIMKALHKPLEFFISSSFSFPSTTGKENNSNNSFLTEALWLCKSILSSPVQSLSTSSNTTQISIPISLLSVHLNFLEKCLLLGYQSKSRIIIRRCFEALGYLFELGDFDFFENKKNKNENEKDSENNNNQNNQNNNNSLRIKNLLQIHAPRFTSIILSVVSAPWMFSVTSCAETLLRITSPSPQSQSLLLKWLVMDNDACTSLHEAALNLVAAGSGEAAEKTSGGIRKTGNKNEETSTSTTKTATSSTDANDFVFVSLTHFPEAQLRLKGLHMEVSERF